MDRRTNLETETHAEMEAAHRAMDNGADALKRAQTERDRAMRALGRVSGDKYEVARARYDRALAAVDRAMDALPALIAAARRSESRWHFATRPR